MYHDMGLAQGMAQAALAQDDPVSPFREPAIRT
jgi:hypothetical protein